MEVGLVKQINIDDEMRESYLSYAMSVIVSRALPDVRDGLKPSQRRILVAMNDLNLSPGGFPVEPESKAIRAREAMSASQHPDLPGILCGRNENVAEVVNGEGVPVLAILKLHQQSVPGAGPIPGEPIIELHHTERRPVRGFPEFKHGGVAGLQNGPAG